VASPCNDIAIGPKHTVYISDSLGKIYALRDGAEELIVASDDRLLAPSTAGGFGANGLAWDGGEFLYVDATSDARLLRLPIFADGELGAAEQISVTPALKHPDALRHVHGDTFLVVDGAGDVAKLAIEGQRARSVEVITGLREPTSVVVEDGNYWVTEGQLQAMFTAGAEPVLPFLVRGF
jgi:sugar lactone lactonase YvrE